MASFCHSYLEIVTARCAKSRSSGGFQTDTKVFLSVAPVMARHTVSAELSCFAGATKPDTDRRDETG